MLTPSVVAEVEMLRWPGDATRRKSCAERDVPCLLLLEEGVAPPLTNRPLEDWIRVPADELDLVARIRRLEALGNRASERPTVDDDGILRVGPSWTALSVAEARLAHRLTADFGHLVARDELLAALAPPTASPPATSPSATSPSATSVAQSGAGALPADRRPRTLDLQICRLRRRISVVGLTVSAVRGRGYVLEHARPSRQPSGSRPS